MIANTIPDDGIRTIELGKYRFRVNPHHEAEVIWAIRKRHKRESQARAA